MQVSGNSCVGGFVQLDTSGTSAPPWSIGDTFLKNMYSVFRASPAAVGSAQLSSTETSMNGQLGPCRARRRLWGNCHGRERKRGLGPELERGRSPLS